MLMVLLILGSSIVHSLRSPADSLYAVWRVLSVNDTWSTSSLIPSHQLHPCNESPSIFSPLSPDQASDIPSLSHRLSSRSLPLPILNWLRERIRCFRFFIRNTLRCWLRGSSRLSKSASAMRKLLLENICCKVSPNMLCVRLEINVSTSGHSQDPPVSKFGRWYKSVPWSMILRPPLTSPRQFAQGEARTQTRLSQVAF